MLGDAIGVLLRFAVALCGAAMDGVLLCGMVLIGVGLEDQYGVGGIDLIAGALAMHVGGKVLKVDVAGMARCERKYRARGGWPWDAKALWWNEIGSEVLEVVVHRALAHVWGHNFRHRATDCPLAQRTVRDPKLIQTESP